MLLRYSISRFVLIFSTVRFGKWDMVQWRELPKIRSIIVVIILAEAALT